MHEISIAQDMMRLAEDSLNGVFPLRRVVVTIGPLSGVDPDALDFCFEEIAQQMGFGRPELVINKVPARALCLKCNIEYPLEDVYTFCPKCNSFSRKLLCVQVFTLDSIETT